MIVVEIAGVVGELTVIAMLFEFAVCVVKQVAFDNIVQLTTSRLVKNELLYVVPVPTGPPFKFHTKVGFAPPFVMAVVNVTIVPAQAGLLDGEITSDGVDEFVIETVMAFEVTVAVVAHGEFEVITHVITSLFAKVVLA